MIACSPHAMVKPLLNGCLRNDRWNTASRPADAELPVAVRHRELVQVGQQGEGLAVEGMEGGGFTRVGLGHVGSFLPAPLVSLLHHNAVASRLRRCAGGKQAGRAVRTPCK